MVVTLMYVLKLKTATFWHLVVIRLCATACRRWECDDEALKKLLRKHFFFIQTSYMPVWVNFCFLFLFDSCIDKSFCRHCDVKTTKLARLERNARVTMKVTLNLNDSLKSEFSNITYDFSMKKFSYKLKSNNDESAYMSDWRFLDLIRYSEWYMSEFSTFFLDFL